MTRILIKDQIAVNLVRTDNQIVPLAQLLKLLKFFTGKHMTIRIVWIAEH